MAQEIMIEKLSLEEEIYQPFQGLRKTAKGWL